MSGAENKPFVASAKWYLNQAMVKGRYSAGLIREFDAHVENQTANIFPIFAEIATLEGVKAAKRTQTKPAAKFAGKWLKGLWHKHYTQARFIRTNLALHWTPNRLSRMLVDVFSTRELSLDDAARELGQRLVPGGYMQRARSAKLTGEWIIFAKQEGIAYYLTLGAHDEKDELVWRRCKACSSEFPDLRILQEDRYEQ